jgi:hypothetical protein
LNNAGHQGGEHVAQRIVARDAAFAAVEAPEERLTLRSTKSSAPAIVADNTRSRISGNGYRTPGMLTRIERRSEVKSD